jgi:hypothetical protein
MGLGYTSVHPRYSILFSAYGVKIRFNADDKTLFEEANKICREALLGRIQDLPPNGQEDIVYDFRLVEEKVECELFGEIRGPFNDRSVFALFLNSSVRAQVAARSKDWVFIHAGVVEWRGKAIVIPGRSFHGKTTLVSELLRSGATYKSDEFAILSMDGLIHSFERDLAVRVNGSKPSVPIAPEDFGSTRSTVPIEAGMVVFGNYVPGSDWNPTRISVGNGILAMIPEILSISLNTEFALKVLNTTFNRAIIVKSDRGEARDTAPKILAYFDESLAGAEILA